jgi:hypothetical protein
MSGLRLGRPGDRNSTGVDPCRELERETDPPVGSFMLSARWASDMPTTPIGRLADNGYRMNTSIYRDYR